LGAQILSGKEVVNIFGEPHEVKARVASCDAFSGHADKNELVHYISKLQGKMKQIFVIHGEASQSLAFAETLASLKPHADILVPQPGQKCNI
jgi:metallo-beta-lactamase family protein